MDTNVKTALDRILRARTELIMTRTFYGVAVGQVEPKPSTQFPTMATDGKTHYFNPNFINALSPDEVLGTQAHESEHDMRRHHTRRGWRDSGEWNKACDYAINVDLVDAGFKLPQGALIDPKYRGMSAEDIYRSREIERAEEERKRQQERQEQEPEEAADDAESEQDEGADDGDEQEPGDEQDTGDQDGDQDEDEAGGDAGDDSDQGDDQDGDDQGDDQDSGDQGEGAGEAKGEPEGDGAGEGPAGENGEAQGDGEAGGGDAEGEAEAGTDPRSSGDPGGCGEVLDAAPDSAGKADEDAKWERVLRQAARLAAKRGEAPGHIAREIERADHPPQDWREVLRAYFDGGATTTETWNRPNRRFVGRGLYLPGRVRDGVNKAVFMIDTSGSVTWYPGALEAIQVETQAALDEHIIDEVVVIYGDTRVTRVDSYRSGDEIEFDPLGGGGTEMAPLFAYAREQVEDASLIVAFTDLEIEPEEQLGPEPACPVLWAVVGYPASVKQYLAATPWNAPGIEVRPDQ